MRRRRKSPAYVDEKGLLGAETGAGLVDDVAHKLVTFHQRVPQHFLVVPADIALNLSLPRSRSHTGYTIDWILKG